MEESKTPSKAQIERDARTGGSNNCVSSAKPRVITHSDDMTVNKKIPGKEKGPKDWDLNYDERDRNEGDFRG